MYLVMPLQPTLDKPGQKPGKMLTCWQKTSGPVAPSCFLTSWQDAAQPKRVLLSHAQKHVVASSKKLTRMHDLCLPQAAACTGRVTALKAWSE